jgi:hypothetical protein
MLHLYAALAEKERRLISERTTAALQAKKANGDGYIEDWPHGLAFPIASQPACAHVRFGSRLCENSEVQMARRNSVSIFLDFRNQLHCEFVLAEGN